MTVVPASERAGDKYPSDPCRTFTNGPFTGPFVFGKLGGMGREIHVHVTDHLGLHDEAKAELHLWLPWSKPSPCGRQTTVIAQVAAQFGFHGTAGEAARMFVASGRYTLETHPASGRLLVRHREDVDPVS
jgi:hypothetical protein